VYKTAGTFSYVRVAGAGHEVPAYLHGARAPVVVRAAKLISDDIRRHARAWAGRAPDVHADHEQQLALLDVSSRAWLEGSRVHEGSMGASHVELHRMATTRQLFRTHRRAQQAGLLPAPSLAHPPLARRPHSRPPPPRASCQWSRCEHQLPLRWPRSVFWPHSYSDRRLIASLTYH
jgi:hypothetical protein